MVAVEEEGRLAGEEEASGTDEEGGEGETMEGVQEEVVGGILHFQEEEVVGGILREDKTVIGVDGKEQALAYQEFKMKVYTINLVHKSNTSCCSTGFISMMYLFCNKIIVWLYIKMSHKIVFTLWVVIKNINKVMSKSGGEERSCTLSDTYPLLPFQEWLLIPQTGSLVWSRRL